MIDPSPGSVTSRRNEVRDWRLHGAGMIGEEATFTAVVPVRFLSACGSKKERTQVESILQQEPIDVAAWLEDELYFNYPEGARSKKALFPPDAIDLPFIKQNRRYLYKRSVKRYPDQFWGEVVAYQVGGLLGVNVPPAFAAFDSNANDCGALIEWFYEDGKASFVPGGNYMQKLMPDYDRKKGTQHNFQSIQILSRAFSTTRLSVQDWPLYWGETFLFDALIGNTDRHQDNWGYLFVRSRKRRTKAELSPLFDNGTSLGHERFTDAVEAWTDEDFSRYVARGTHHMRWSRDAPKKSGHFQMIQQMIAVYPVLRPVLLEKIRQFSTESLDEKLDALEQLPMPVPLTNARRRLYMRLIAERQKNIQSVLE